MYLVDDKVAVEEELADVDRRRETTDMCKCVGLSISGRVDYLDIAEIEGEIEELVEPVVRSMVIDVLNEELQPASDEDIEDLFDEVTEG